MRISRRAALTGAGVGTAAVVVGGAGVVTGALPGRAQLYSRLGLDGEDGRIPDVEPGDVVSGELVSAARGGRRVGWSLAIPPGVTPEGLPLVVVLHARGGDHTSAFSPAYLGLDRFLAAAVAHGMPPVALASIDGGNAYWHARADGDDPGAMVVDELLPLLADRGLDTGRLGFLGWSMGGFGALRLAGLLGPGRVGAVAALSPALWRDFDDTAPGAFDDAADFDAVTVMGRQGDLDGIPVRVDCGLGDPFCAAAEEYVAGFDERPAGGFERGDHDRGYWRRLVGPQLRFVGERV
ncbi:alpha/beta hydrolase-fold protein [Nocardioides zeae]|uniref:alpha/beta hydrolase-fold protein n=1 Tax=Nocardioides zeae TaxID=1457234 RepID=UPI00308468FC